MVFMFFGLISSCLYSITDCRPGPVDSLFLVDISTSSQTECDRVRSFVSSLVSQIAIGSDDFQVAVISYSFTATLLWDFTQYSNNITLLSAINNMSCTGGATLTGKALKLAREVIANNSVGVRSGLAYKQVVLIYDGMSTDRSEAIQESQALAADYIQLYVVGIGHFVDHNELHSLVQDPTYVFSTTDSELLTTILHTTAHVDCTDCVQSTSTDILLLLDSRSREKIKHCIKSGIEMVRFLDIDSTDINMGIYTYSDSIDRKVPIEKNSENQLLLSIPVITLSTSSDENLSRIVSHGKQELDIYGRADSRKILILFSDGQFNDLIDIKNAVQNATDAETTVLIFGAGKTVNHTAIRNVVTDSYYALLSASSDDYTPLQTVKSESRYTVCAEDIFQARV
uniref:Cartilage matrix protein n=1 Tax=Pinctada fucata TaxID=50426 RepID=A0A2C9DIS9_PINFU|nr:cartilage matrix protein [Pinctada fucata]